MLGLALAFQQEELIEPLLLALEKGIERFPESDDLHWLLGETLRAVGSLELARRVFESAASLMKARERT